MTVTPSPSPAEPREVLAEALHNLDKLWHAGQHTLAECSAEWFAALTRAQADAILAAMPKHLLVRKDEWERRAKAIETVLEAVRPRPLGTGMYQTPTLRYDSPAIVALCALEAYVHE